ncbi:MAG: rRNA maturation RNase YbeY [Kiloniellales bacterium]
MTDDDDEPYPSPRSLEIDVLCESPAWGLALPDPISCAETAARAALAATGVAGPASLAVSLADDGAIVRLNAAYRGKNTPTNVLSFPDGAVDPTGRAALGDVILAYETVAREAIQQAKPLADHLSHLTAHGVLHLLGWDHETEAEAEAMEAMERSILAGLGIADPYEARALKETAE